MNRIFILNKPTIFTSQDAVSKLKKILNQKKAGHTGTLDPMATGVLPILVGDTTKLSKYLVEHTGINTYVARAEENLPAREQKKDTQNFVLIKSDKKDRIKNNKSQATV